MNFWFFRSIHLASATLLLASLTGCVIIKDTDTTTPTSGSGTSGTSDETSVDTDGATITTEVPTSTDASATGDSTTADATTADATTADATTTGGSTGGVNPALQAACEAACAVFLECQPGSYPDLATCAAECIDGASGPTCEAAATDFNSCIGGFTCAELDAALMSNEFGACTEVFNAYVTDCNP